MNLLSKKVSTEAVKVAMANNDLCDLSAWGIDHEIKSLFGPSEYYGRPTVTIDHDLVEFDVYPDQCFWEMNSRAEWTLYLIGTVKAVVKADWREGRSLISTVELTSVTYPLDVENNEFLRDYIPTAEEPPTPEEAEYRSSYRDTYEYRLYEALSNVMEATSNYDDIPEKDKEHALRVMDEWASRMSRATHISAPSILDAERTKHVKAAHQHINREVITCLVLLEEELRSKAGQPAFEILWGSKHYQSLRDFLEV